MFSVRVSDLKLLFPALICSCYYLVVLFLAELSRRVVDVLGPRSRSSLAHTFLIELIGTAQMCTCVYENGIMIKHYGVYGYFFTAFTLLLIASFINRGAFVSPLAPIEAWCRGKMQVERLLVLLLAQVLGATLAYRFANNLWYYSLAYSTDHHANYEHLPCSIAYKVPFVYAFAFEVFGCFTLRLVLHRLPLAYKRYLAPLLTASLLSFALVYIGVPGLNPVVASSRLQGCAGLDYQWFIMTYWLCPVVGWLLASRFDRKKTKAKGSTKSSTAPTAMTNGTKKHSATANGTMGGGKKKKD